MESWLDNCWEPGRLPSVPAAAGLRPGLESVAHKDSTWLQTKLTPALEKQLLPGLKNLVTTGPVRCSSSAGVVGVSLPHAAVAGCSRELFFPLLGRNRCRAWSCCAGVACALQGCCPYSALGA